MAIHRAPRPDDHFTQIRNDVLRDDRLSYRARGLLAVILSHTDGWSTSSEALARAGKEGRDAIRTALQELEDSGYLLREKRQDSQGRIATHQVIYDTPHLDAQPALFPTGDGFSGVGQPGPGKPTPDNQAPLEDHQEEPSPTGKGASQQAPAHVIATAVYEHTQGMVNFMAVRQVAGRALKVDGATPERVQAAMTGVYDQGRPITLQTVGQWLSRGSFRDAGEGHWAQGGEF